MTETQKLTSLKAAGQVAAKIHEQVGAMIRPGLNLLEIEKFVTDEITKAGMKPAFPTNDFPATTCLSVNDEIVHGLPHDYELQEGDVVKVDLGVLNNGWMVDTAVTHGVGKISDEDQALLVATKLALETVIPYCRAGNQVGDLGATIERVIKKHGFSIIKDLAGHGVGQKLQEEPSIPNFGRYGTGSKLKAGMCLAIEPITCLKPTKIGVLADGWTIVAENRMTTAQFEHTILITDGDPLVLTKLK